MVPARRPQHLVRAAEHDVYPFYPDLVIFHASGADQEYQEIVTSIRSRTTAEVLLLTDPATKSPPDGIDRGKGKGEFVQAMAKKYGCGLCDIHSGWLDYLKAHKLEPKDLVTDDGRLNDHGNYLMAVLVKRHLVRRPDLADTIDKDNVKTFPVRYTRLDNTLTFEFEGNRIDMLPISYGIGVHPGRITIDGRKPSQWHEAYFVTRPTPGPGAALFLSRVGHEKPLALENWTLQLIEISPDSRRWRFAVRGSKTGPDGEGTSDRVFTSPSGRVTITPDAWFRNLNRPLPVGYEIKWSVNGVFSDHYSPHYSKPDMMSDPENECATTIIQGLPNGKHTIVVTPSFWSASGARALRVYRPPVK